jgi:hypothetical protein
MLLNICFGFMMLIASLIEFAHVLKRGMWQEHKTHLANFDKPGLRIIWFRWRPLLGCRHIEMSRPESSPRKQWRDSRKWTSKISVNTFLLAH